LLTIRAMLDSILTRLRLTRQEGRKAALLSAWFFLTITTLWVLKPIRSASLLVHLGAEELPYVRLATVVIVGLVVANYSRFVNRFSRITVAGGSYLLFAAVLAVFWVALTLGGPALGSQRWFVWSVFIMVDLYATVMVGIFWIYTNDVVSSPEEADRLYGPIGIGGVLGGIVGGASVDALVRLTGPVNLLLLSAGLCVGGAMVVWTSEHTLRPAPRLIDHKTMRGVAAATEGLREVRHSGYLLLIVSVVITYEFAAAMTDFVVNVIFERSFPSEVELAKMFGRLGWIASATALVSQIALVPLALPRKRLALLAPPIAMGLASTALALAPLVAVAIVLSAADRGLNYSLQQAAKETLYVPLSDAQKYKGKAVIDMFMDRLGKALSAVTLIVVIATAGTSIRLLLAIALGAIALWTWCADRLGRAYAVKVARMGAATTTPGSRARAGATDAPSQGAPVGPARSSDVPPAA
jgi:AAA family ATP:ADP antiporter